MNEILSKRSFLDFPNSLEVKNLCVNAGDTGLIPGPGRFHMPWDNEAHVPQLLSPGTLEPCSPTREATPMRSPHTTAREEPQLSATGGSPLEQQRLRAGKNKLNKQIKMLKADHSWCWIFIRDGEVSTSKAHSKSTSFATLCCRNTLGPDFLFS